MTMVNLGNSSLLLSMAGHDYFHALHTIPGIEIPPPRPKKCLHWREAEVSIFSFNMHANGYEIVTSRASTLMTFARCLSSSPLPSLSSQHLEHLLSLLHLHIEDDTRQTTQCS